MKTIIGLFSILFLSTVSFAQFSANMFVGSSISDMQTEFILSEGRLVEDPSVGKGAFGLLLGMGVEYQLKNKLTINLDFRAEIRRYYNRSDYNHDSNATNTPKKLENINTNLLFGRYFFDRVRLSGGIEAGYTHFRDKRSNLQLHKGVGKYLNPIIDLEAPLIWNNFGVGFRYHFLRGPYSNYFVQSLINFRIISNYEAREHLRFFDLRLTYRL